MALYSGLSWRNVEWRGHSYRRTAGRFPYSFDVPILFEIKVDSVFVVHILHGMNVLEVEIVKAV